MVQRIFADFLGGASTRGLAVALVAEGIASPDDKPVWPLATIGRLRPSHGRGHSIGRYRLRRGGDVGLRAKVGQHAGYGLGRGPRTSI